MKVHRIETESDQDVIQIVDQFSISEPIPLAWIIAMVEEREKQRELELVND